MANPKDYNINTAKYSMQLMRGQMLNFLATSDFHGGLSLNEFILGKVAKTDNPRQALPQSLENYAITKLARSNSGNLRLEAEGMRENGLVVSLAGKALEKVSEKLSQMQSLTARAETAYTEKNALQQRYNSLAAEIAGVVAQCVYKGVNLLDGATWAREERISSTDGYDTGKFRVNGQTQGPGQMQGGPATQSPGAASGGVSGEITLFSLSGFKESFHGKDLDNLPLTRNKLEYAQSIVSSVRNSYEARAGLYEKEAANLERQADILDLASQKVNHGDEQQLKSAIVELLLRDQNNNTPNTPALPQS